MTKKTKEKTTVKNAKAPVKKAPATGRKPIIGRRPHDNYKFIDMETRINVVYDNFTHNLQPLQISQKRNLKYNTVRSLLENFYQHGRVNIKKKMCGYKRNSYKNTSSKKQKNPPKKQIQKKQPQSKKVAAQCNGKRPYCRTFLQNKVEQPNVVTKAAGGSKRGKTQHQSPPEKHSAFILKGP